MDKIVEKCTWKTIIIGLMIDAIQKIILFVKKVFCIKHFNFKILHISLLELQRWHYAKIYFKLQNLLQNHVATNFPLFGPEFKIKMRLTFSSFPSDDKTVFSIFSKAGFAIVALMAGQSETLKFHHAIKTEPIKEYTVQKQKPQDILISQSLKNDGKCMLEIHVKNQVIFSIQMENTGTFTNTKLYLSPSVNADVEYFFVDHGHDSQHDEFTKNNYISMVGDTTKPNGIMSSQFWPSSLYKLLNIKKPELTCAEMCALIANCQFYYFVDLMPSQDNACHFGDFAHADYNKQYDEITDDTEYKLDANLDLKSFGAGANPACPGSGHTKLEMLLTIEYIGTTEASCYYSMYAPDAKELKIQIEQLIIHDGDFMNLVVAPTFGGHRYISFGPASSGGEHRVQSRFLKVFWKNVDTNIEAKWKMTITPLY